jgi:hypothetical protein
LWSLSTARARRVIKAIHQNDPMLVAIKAELLHGIPELTGKQINTAAMLALVAINRWNETSKAEYKKVMGEG